LTKRGAWVASSSLNAPAGFSESRQRILLVTGGPGDPYRYTTVHAFAGVINGKKAKDTAHAKQMSAF
jgi:hypothetical protein